ncbi:DPH3 homolog [Clonorchis sinensis]|uniref:Diphthamide biosynthesis protein 3 n=1 Tax=Clonorchis sinensis TaxID=79923 RepID=G7YH80_CLOSI|nr:DPH3 homolog [Clonorchis sinensis]
MSVFHDEIEIEDMEYDAELETYFYPCPCGDRFQITRVNCTCHKKLHLGRIAQW